MPNPVPPEIQAEIDALSVSKKPPRTDLIPEATGDWNRKRAQARRSPFFVHNLKYNDCENSFRGKAV
jgi:hypothetical protein